MAIFKTFYYNYVTGAMFEDPTPGKNKIYFMMDQYDSTTLAPQNNKGINFSINGSNNQGFGVSNTYVTTNYEGSLAFRLGLNGPVTDVQTISTSLNTPYVNIEPSMFLSMDPARPIRKNRIDTFGGNTMMMSSGAKLAANPGGINRSTADANQQYTTYYTFRFNPTDVSNQLPLTNNNTMSYGTGTYTPFRQGGCNYPVYYNSSTNNMVMLGWAGYFSPTTTDSNQNDLNYFATAPYGMRFTNYMTASPSLQVNSTTSQINKTNQFLGVDNGGRAWFFQDDITTDFNLQIIRYNDSDNTYTTMFTSNVAPSAGGTSAGGNRGTNYGSYYPKFSSTTFTDPLNANGVAWYTPFNDVGGNIQPYYFQWDKSLDTVSLSSNLTVNWGNTSQATEWQVDLQSPSSVNVTYSFQRLLFNDVFTHNDGVTTRRYLMWGQLSGTGVLFDGNSKQRTFVIFLVDPSNPRTLTYHSDIVIPTTPINILWLDNAKNQLAIISAAATYFYNFTHANGWVLSATIPVRYASLGVDSLGRIWGLAAGPTQSGQVHLITNQIPVTISVQSANTSYNYTGNNISSNVIVNAYNTSGSRIAANIKLAISGTSMTFSGSNLTTTITTSNSANTLVPITITGSGTSTVVASVIV